ncbi:MAG: zinc-ribbon domain-containing protein [Oscillospiraceae bacterium]|jgi:hypothetical protein|nr:zinc-ribbon domain-containing protein [Oscillospiraceae bacterium]
MFCNKCGATTDDDSVFCSVCGASLSAPPTQEQPAQQHAVPKVKKPINKPLLAIGAGALVLVVAIVSVIAIFINAPQKEQEPDPAETLTANTAEAAMEGYWLALFEEKDLRKMFEYSLWTAEKLIETALAYGSSDDYRERLLKKYGTTDAEILLEKASIRFKEETPSIGAADMKKYLGKITWQEISKDNVWKYMEDNAEDLIIALGDLIGDENVYTFLDIDNISQDMVYTNDYHDYSGHDLVIKVGNKWFIPSVALMLPALL